MKILGIMKGGVGDCLMIANLAATCCDFTIAVEDYQIPLISKIKGCKVISIKATQNHKIVTEYDEVINFAYFLSSGHCLRTGDYYSLVEDRLGLESPVLAGFNIPRTPQGGIYVHLQASNPNRDWLRDQWTETLMEISKTDTVYLLGRRAEFKVKGDNIVDLSLESDNLLWQAERLATANYFIGVDSGFCHIAGILGIPGKVLFFNTKAEDVIARYQSLEGIDSFGGMEPSRSTRIPCLTSERFKKELNSETLIKTIQNAYNYQ